MDSVCAEFNGQILEQPLNDLFLTRWEHYMPLKKKKGKINISVEQMSQTELLISDSTERWGHATCVVLFLNTVFFQLKSLIEWR